MPFKIRILPNIRRERCRVVTAEKAPHVKSDVVFDREALGALGGQIRDCAEELGNAIVRRRASGPSALRDSRDRCASAHSRNSKRIRSSPGEIRDATGCMSRRPGYCDRNPLRRCTFL
jgi:hypothetical protein